MGASPVAGRFGFVVMAFFCLCGFTTSAFSQTFIFSDDPLTAGVTLVQAVHITELRDDINVLRLRQDLLPVTFPDAVGPGLGPIRAIHIAELRTALDDVFDSLGRSRPPYTDAPQPAAGVTLIKLLHVAELRNAVRAAGLLILTASRTGTGSGTVTSNPVGIDCGSDCTEPYLPGRTVTLTASPAAGSVFAGWNGSCTGTESCLVTMTTADRSVTATFTTVPPPLSCTLDASVIDLVPGAGVSIMGTAALGLFDVRVNGAPVAVAADRTFSATVTGRYGLNFVELSATDGAGAPRTALCAFLGAEHWAMEGVRFDLALMFRMEPAGFNKIKNQVAGWFSGPNLPQSLDSSLAANIGHTVIGNCAGFGTCADIQYLSLSATLRSNGVVISVPNSNLLNVRVTYDIRLRLRVSGKESGVPRGPITGDAVFTNTAVSADVALSIDSATGVPYGRGENVSVYLSADWSQFNGLGDTVRNMASSFVEAELQSSLGPIVLGGAAGLFEGLLAGMDVTVPAAGFPVGRLDGTANVTVAMTRWSGIGLFDGGLILLTGLRVTSPPPPPAATGRIPLPMFGNSYIPDVGWDARSAVHIGVYNQVLQALWRAGLFDGTVDGAALGSGLPAGTSVSVQLRTMPVVTGFDPATTGLDVGALDLVVTHPDLPPGLRVTVGARMQASASLVSDDLVFGDIVASELRFSTGAVALDAASRATLEDLIRRLLVKLANIALNDSLPVLPDTVFTFPPSLGAYGFTVGGRLLVAPLPVIGTHRVILHWTFGSF